MQYFLQHIKARFVSTHILGSIRLLAKSNLDNEMISPSEKITIFIRYVDGSILFLSNAKGNLVLLT